MSGIDRGKWSCSPRDMSGLSQPLQEVAESSETSKVKPPCNIGISDTIDRKPMGFNTSCS